MTQTLAAFGPDTVQTGVFPGIAAENAPLWATGENISFWNGRAKTSAGILKITDLNVRCYALEQAYTLTGRKRAYAIAENKVVYAWEEGQNPQRIGQVDNLQAMLVPWGNGLIVAERGDRIKLWPGKGTLVRIPKAPRAALAIIDRDRVVAFRTEKGDSWVEWSHYSNPLIWEPEKKNDARNLPLRNLDSAINAARHIGDRLAVYTNESIVVLGWHGSPVFYGEVNRIDGIGVEGKYCVVQVGHLNFGFSRFGIFQTDGNQFSRIDTTALGDMVENEVDWSRTATITGFHNKAFDEVRWHFFDVKGLRRGIGLNYNTGAYALYTLPIYAASARDVFNYPIVSTLEGPGLLQGITDKKSWIRTKPIDAGDPTLFKLWEAIQVVLKGDDVWVKIGLHDQPGEEPTWVVDERLYNTVLLPQAYREAAFVTVEIYTDNRGWMEVTQLIASGEPGGSLL